MCLFRDDYYRMTGQQWSCKSVIYMMLRYDLRYLKHIRSHRRGLIYKLADLKYNRRYGLEVLSSNIGPGLYIGHGHNINVNPSAVIGKNCNLNKGCTVGAENRGIRKGAPVLGDMVWVGSNAVVVGKVNIGDDVLIAPNAYVNFDVPSHSIVIGNPARIIPCQYATRDYICNQI